MRLKLLVLVVIGLSTLSRAQTATYDALTIRSNSTLTGAKLFGNGPATWDSNVGPGYLQLYGSRIYDNGDYLHFTDGATKLNIHSGNSSSPVNIKIDGAGPSYFNSGFLGVGTTSPNHVLTVEGQGTSGSVQANIYNPSAQPGATAGIRFHTGSGWNVMLRTNQDNSWLELVDGAGGLQHKWVGGSYFPSGSVGIGTNSPAGLLHVNGNGSSIHLTSSDWAAIRGNQSTWLFGYGGAQGSEDISIGTQDGSGSRTLTFAAGGSAKMKVLANGNVGIGTTTPDNKLTVKGKIHAEEVKVDLSVPGPDYVFEPDYKLTSLEELKQYIDQHKHLPEIPSAKEMESNGINLMEMNVLLLKKVEELTLHILNQQEEITDLKSIVLKIQTPKACDSKH